MKEALCRAFCENLCVQEVPVGLAVGTSFRRSNGDAVGFYIVYEQGSRARARIEDDGLTIASLEAAGVNLTSGPRAEQFAALLRQSHIFQDEDESLLHTDFMSVERLPASALEFVAFLIRVQEFMHWTREAVEETFKDDVIRAVQVHYAGRAQVHLGAEIENILPGSPADAVIEPPTGTPLALFIGTSEPKALEATLLWSDVLANMVMPTKVILVVDSPKPRRIRDKTYARAIARFPVTVFPGMQTEALAAMDRSLFGEGGGRGEQSIH